MADRSEVSSLPVDLSLGNLLAYEPVEPASDDLFVFLPGTSSSCENYSQLLELVAPSMYTVCLPYDNIEYVASRCKQDNGCFEKVRLAAFNGTFDAVSGNNIESRLVSALRYLAEREGEAWSRYVEPSSGLPVWRRVRLAGHSQGAGDAALIGYYRELARVVQFAGVCDRSDWTSRLGPPVTPPSRFFGLANRWDTVICPAFTSQVKSWRGEGAVPPGAPALELEGQRLVNITSLDKSQTVVSSLRPPGCDGFARRTIACARKAHQLTAANWPSRLSPYTQGLWQALCGV